jgi:hypothetical protein
MGIPNRGHFPNRQPEKMNLMVVVVELPPVASALVPNSGAVPAGLPDPLKVPAKPKPVFDRMRMVPANDLRRLSEDDRKAVNAGLKMFGLKLANSSSEAGSQSDDSVQPKPTTKKQRPRASVAVAVPA